MKLIEGFTSYNIFKSFAIQIKLDQQLRDERDHLSVKTDKI